MLQVREIGGALDQYVADHGGQYPGGKTSTEVFQKLIDAHYLEDPGVLYLPLSGKRQAVQFQTLKPENVCFDVTEGGGNPPPKWLPLVFTTGFRITYVPGAAAVPLKPLSGAERFWLKTLSARWTRNHGIAVWLAGPFRNDYVGGTATFIPPGMELHAGTNAWSLDTSEGAVNDGSLRHFVQPIFQPGDHHFVQLTPDRPLL